MPGAITALMVGLSYIATWYYWDSGLYQGRIETEKSSGGNDILSIFLVAGLVFFMKYFLYELVSRRYARTLATTVVFYGAYVVAICIDAMSIFLSFSPLAAAGFAILAAIVISPVLLCITWVSLLIGATASRNSTSRL